MSSRERHINTNNKRKEVASITYEEMSKNMSKEIGRPVDVAELFRQTHVRKDIGEFVDDRARRTYEDYHARLQRALSQSSESSSFTSGCQSMDALKARCWLEAAEGKKGKVYNTCVIAPNILQGENPLSQISTPATSTSQQSREILELQERMTLLSEENQQLKDRLARIEELLMFQLLPPYEHEDEQHDDDDDDVEYEDY